MFGFQKRPEFKPRGSFKRQRLSGRADAVLAPAAEISEGMTINSRNFNQHAVFCSLAASRSTCCIRISSARQKSRATLILFRGRVLSCVYGKRGMLHYTFGQAAFTSAQLDLLQQQSEFSIHSLSEESALAAASFFEGHQQDQPSNQLVQDFFTRTSHEINSRKAPGCFVVRDDARNTNSVIYFHGGKITGIYSYDKGWLRGNRFETAMKTVSSKKTYSTSAYMLPALSMHEIYNLTFSLTGVDDTETDREEWINSVSNNEVTPLLRYSQKPSGLRHTFSQDSKTSYESALNEINRYALRQVRQHGHSIDPGADKAS
jgi:hypothetical protein